MDLSNNNPSWGFSKLFQQLSKSDSSLNYSKVYRTYRRLGLREKRIDWFKESSEKEYPVGNINKGGNSWFIDELFFETKGPKEFSLAALVVCRNRNGKILGIIQEPFEKSKILDSISTMVKKNRKPRHIRIYDHLGKNITNNTLRWCKSQQITFTRINRCKTNQRLFISPDNLSEIISKISTD
ncbi:MAG: hypothetical protein HOK84_11915 [Bacteroidetes bacterium]|nr:hypothetical protein [Bacteroidota bacterium]